MALETLDPSTPPDLDALAREYVDLIYASALRQLGGDSHAAADVTQTVMIIMIQKTRAHALPRKSILTGWLVNVTRYTVMQFRRSSARRARHEAAAPVVTEPSPGLNTEMRSALDAAILALNSIDREVVIRRHLRGETLAQVAAAVGMTENAATRRVARAMEKLRKVLHRRGISAPMAVVATVLSVESGIKAPVACASVATASGAHLALAQKVIWKWAAGKFAAIFAATLVSLSLITGVLIMAVHTPAIPPPASIAAKPSVAPTMPMSPQRVIVKVAKVLDPPSQALLKNVLAHLEENRLKIHTIHIVASTYASTMNLNGNGWNKPLVDTGVAWAEASASRPIRIEANSFQSRSMNIVNGKIGPTKTTSFIESWDGNTVFRLYGPPLSDVSGETWTTRDSVQAAGLLGADFSIRFSWDREESADAMGSHVTIDRDPLDPAVLAKMNLTARRVQLDDGREAMELSVDVPDPTLKRNETFWFDAARGYGLLAREDTLAMNGVVISRRTRIVDAFIEAATGIFYPSKAVDFWEMRGTPILWEEFEATSVRANELLPTDAFGVKFPKGITIYDFNGGRGVKRVEK